MLAGIRKRMITQKKKKKNGSERRAPVIHHISKLAISFEPQRQKTGLRGFRPGPTQIRLRRLRKCVAKTKLDLKFQISEVEGSV